MNTMKQLRIVYLLLVGLLFGVTMAACQSKSSNQRASVNQTVSVRTVLPEMVLHNGIPASGVVESEQTAMISTRMMGTIEKIYVKEGEAVQNGQLLAAISNREIIARQRQVEAALQEALAALENAEKDEARFRTLFQSQSVSAKELENVQLHYRSMQARVASAREMLNETEVALQYTQLRAPYAGVVTRVMSDAGTMASPGMPLLVVEQTGKLQVSATIAETDVVKVQSGDSAQITVKAAGVTTKGRVTAVSPSSAATGGQYLVKVSLPDSVQAKLFPGMYVHLFLPGKGEEEPGRVVSNPMIPREALFYREQLSGVWVVGSNNVALLRWVRLGKSEGNLVTVVSGLRADEPVIVKYEGKLYNGVSVEVL